MTPITLYRCASVLGVAGALALPGVALAQQFVYNQFKEPLPMIQRSVLTDPDGKMGEVAFDPRTRCYYFAAPRSGMLMMMDPAGVNTPQTIKDLNEPQGLAMVADQRKLLVTCGDGSVLIYKIQEGVPAGPGGNPAAVLAGQLALEKRVKFSGEADPIRYDPKTKKAYFGHGRYLDWIDPSDGTKAPKGIELPGPAKGIAIEQNGDRIFVTVPSENQVVVVDRAKWLSPGEAEPRNKDLADMKEKAAKLEAEFRQAKEKADRLEAQSKEARARADKAEGDTKKTLTQAWPLNDATPFPVSLDEEGSRLFVGSRNPAKLVILDARTGKEQERFDIDDDAQDCWWDAFGKRVYVSAGGNEGRISMIWDKPAIAANTAAEKARLSEIEKSLQGNPAAEKLIQERAELNARVEKIEKFAPIVGWVNEHSVTTAPGCRTSVLVPDPGERRFIAVAPKLGGYPTFVYIYVIPGPNDHHEDQPVSH